MQDRMTIDLTTTDELPEPPDDEQDPDFPESVSRWGDFYRMDRGLPFVRYDCRGKPLPLAVHRVLYDLCDLTMPQRVVYDITQEDVSESGSKVGWQPGLPSLSSLTIPPSPSRPSLRSG